MFEVIIAQCIPFDGLTLFLGKLFEAVQLCHVKLLGART